MNTLGNQIKHLREIHNISQKDFAEKINVSNVVLSRYESGERNPDFDTIEKIADYFDVSIDYLLGRTSLKTYDEKLFSDDVNEIFKKLSLVNKEDRKTIVNTIDALYLLINRQLNKKDTRNLEAIHNIIYDLLYFDNLTKKDEFKSISLNKSNDLIDLLRTYKESISYSMDQIIKNKLENNDFLDFD